MYNYRLIVAYKGTQYKGWQKTQLGNSIEQALEQSLFQILRKEIPLQAASRTDAGVHADKQVVNFLLEQPLHDLSKFLYSLNCTLPKDIRALHIDPMAENFHPTTDAIGKLYCYSICNTQIQLPFHRFTSWHFPYPLKLELMQQGSQHLLGTHDFSAFCNERALWNRNPVCTLTSIQIVLKEPQRFDILIQGDHFLYKMVRNLVGTLAYVGCGKIFPDTIPLILTKRCRTQAGITAPAHGLTLKTVFYTE